MNESTQTSDIIHHRNECYCCCCRWTRVSVLNAHNRASCMKHLWRTLFHFRSIHRDWAPTKATKCFNTKKQQKRKKKNWFEQQTTSEWEQAQEDENQMQKRKIMRKCSYVYDWVREWPEWNKYILYRYSIRIIHTQ